MVATSWTLRADIASKNEIEQWLADEVSSRFSLTSNGLELFVELENIDDAFRFRMHFDEVLKI